MNIFLCGQGYFGALVLGRLAADGHEVVGVSAPFTHPGPDGGRDLAFSLACKLGLPVTQAGRLNAATMPGGVDLIVAAHSHDFISSAVRQRTALGAIGYHPSLLPLHRGRDAIRWTVKMGDRVTGGSVYWLSDAVDGGPIAAQDWCFIRPGDTPSELWQRDLQPMGVELLSEAVRDIGGKRLIMVPQDEALATWEPSWGREPIFRPDLLRIGGVPGYNVLTRRGGREAGENVFLKHERRLR